MDLIKEVSHRNNYIEVITHTKKIDLEVRNRRNSGLWRLECNIDKIIEEYKPLPIT